MIRLETDRLILRDYEPRDLETYIGIESDAEYRRPQVVPTRAELERGFRDDLLVPKALGLWATEERTSGRLIGRCGLYPRRTDAGDIVAAEYSLGYYIARQAWGNGFATEAGRALVAHAFTVLGATRVHAGVHRHNTRSRRVALRLGLQLLGPDPNPGSPALEYAVTREEYAAGAGHRERPPAFEAAAHRWYPRPVFFVADLHRALRHYTGALGFVVKWHEADGAGTVCQVDRSDCEIILCEDPRRVAPARVFIELTAHGRDSLQQELAARGVPHDVLRWGYDNVRVVDPDGNELLFPLDG